MKITLDEARRVAALASLEFSDDDLRRMAGDMSRILDYVDQIEAADVSAVAEEGADAPVADRADEVRSSPVADEAGGNAPSMLHGHFVVPKVIGEG